MVKGRQGSPCLGQIKPGSINLQLLGQPSPLMALPSSHASSESRTPSAQRAEAASPSPSPLVRTMPVVLPESPSPSPLSLSPSPSPSPLPSVGALQADTQAAPTTMKKTLRPKIPQRVDIADSS